MRRIPRPLSLCLVTLALLAGRLPAQFSPFKASAGPQDKSAPKDPPELKPLKYRLLGPAWGGRVSRAVGVPGNPNVFYFAGAASGVWKSTNGGLNWQPVFDDQPVSSIGSIAVAPSDPNVIYVGSGEANIRGNVAAGKGIYKSVDAGKTWTHVWKQEGQIGTMVVHPANPDIAFAAVLGHAFGPNAERGVYRTKDGGKTWQQVLKKDENTGASDVALDPSNPNIIFAGLWQARRFPWDLQSGGPGSGLYMSHDGGDTWMQLDGKEKGKGLPECGSGTICGRIGVAVAPSDGRRVYALVEAEKGGLFRSDNGGESWSLVSASRLVRQRAWYYSTMEIHPTNPNEVWFPQVPMCKTIDGGKTIQMVRGFHHGDHHDLWIDPLNPKRMIASNDGGVDISTDGGETWYAPALPIAQFYHVSADNRVPFSVAGAMQDIGTAQGPSNSLSAGGIRNTDWYRVGGGEAGWVVSDPSDPDIVYAGEYGGIITRYDHRTRQARNVTAYPENPSGHGGEDFKYRFQWTAPIHVSPHNPKVVYHGGNVLFRTSDGGQTWAAISGDLTRNDKSKQKWAGGPITGDNTGVETYCTIFAIAESPAQKEVIWAGSDDGLVHVTRDGGKTWKNVTAAMPGIPEFGTVSMIEASRYDAGTAYVVVDNHRLDDTKPYLYKTADYGQTWQRLDSSLPQDVYLHAIREDSKNRNILYLGTEHGVAFSTDGGRSWQPLKLNLPTVAVHDFAIKENSLILATLGRSLWAFDHLSVIRELTSQVTGTQPHLFTAPDAIRWRWHAGPGDKFAGENPPAGAVIYYWLKEEPKDDFTLEILDANNNVINTLGSKPRTYPGHSDEIEEAQEALNKSALSKAPGVNRAVWDLSYAGAEMVQGAKLDAGNPFTGPLVVPGNYTVRLTVDGWSLTTPLKVLPDPRVQMSEADYKAQLAFALAVRDDITRLTRLANQLRTIRQQLLTRNELLRHDAKAAQLVRDSEALVGKLDALEERIHNPKAEVVYDILAFKGGTKLYSRLAPLYDWATESDGLPTQGMREVYADQKKELDQYEAELKKLVGTDLASLNDAAKKLAYPHVMVVGGSK
ncbi:MAG TPA: glycosyl hydrolase [Blastocatellia bacterium]|nr:glycosyl hydrolase [Blastocatellia bacterium]